MALNAITRLRLARTRTLLPFAWHSMRSFNQVKRTDGCLDAQARKSNGLVFWTLTLWDSGAAMRRYMRDGAHRVAMPKLAQWCDEAATYDWETDTTSLPDWTEAEAKLAAHGRLVPLQHPSPAHAAGHALGTAGVDGQK